ncbi:YajG family lipoprotein [Shewanella glacialipiscicola]|nr:YajG family lipoprotein [Shewanella glacialipiscicola]MCL1086087.1 YajG family lipoprotein [Shewanella glacialipiscicola]MCU7993663.1 YajG family lipoprotein [Shewanella glacialipiscicola]MCU8024981.1 YajG family lipoprotein [Shewanella glacialipiscicola]
MKRLLLTLTFPLLFTGCASQSPTHMAFSPQVPNISQQTAQRSPISMETVDSRSIDYVARFIEEGTKTRLISASEPPKLLLDEVFRAGFTEAGYQIDPSATNAVQIQLEELQMDVTKKTFGYEAKHSVVIAVQAKNSTQELVKRYKAKGILKGPLTPDFATLELDMNKLLGQLTGEILNDPELNQFLQQ